MSDDTYNGWANRETWLVHLWLSNEQPTYEWAREIGAGCETDAQAGDVIEDGLPELLDFPTTGMAADLINQALARVNWAEIGAAFRED